MKSFLLGIWSRCVRLTVRWPSVVAIAPFLLLIAVWWTVTEMQIFPRVFLPGPLDVVHSFGSLVYTGILPEYLQDSMVRLAVGALWRRHHGAHVPRNHFAVDRRRHKDIRLLTEGQ